MQEYGVRVTVDSLPYVCARWPRGTPQALAKVRWPSSGVALAQDQNGQTVCLFSSPWDLQTLSRDYPDVRFSETS